MIHDCGHISCQWCKAHNAPGARECQVCCRLNPDRDRPHIWSPLSYTNLNAGTWAYKPLTRDEIDDGLDELNRFANEGHGSDS